jgi:hypothetical protein
MDPDVSSPLIHKGMSREQAGNILMTFVLSRTLLSSAGQWYR